MMRDVGREQAEVATAIDRVAKWARETGADSIFIIALNGSHRCVVHALGGPQPYTSMLGTLAVETQRLVSDAIYEEENDEGGEP